MINILALLTDGLLADASSSTLRVVDAVAAHIDDGTIRVAVEMPEIGVVIQDDPTAIVDIEETAVVTDATDAQTEVAC